MLGFIDRKKLASGSREVQLRIDERFKDRRGLPSRYVVSEQADKRRVVAVFSGSSAREERQGELLGTISKNWRALPEESDMDDAFFERLTQTRPTKKRISRLSIQELEDAKDAEERHAEKRKREDDSAGGRPALKRHNAGKAERRLRIDMTVQEMERRVIAAFKKHSHYNFKQLERACDLPKNLKPVLARMCDYHTSGDFRFHYSLKDVYKGAMMAPVQ